MSVPTQDNVLGAVVFFSYIVAALLLTGILCVDVQKAFSNRVLFTVQRQQRQTPRQDKKAGADRKASTSLLAALATLSFAVLSYHMLNFLILSYQSWSSSAPISPATLPATPQVTWHAFHRPLGNLSSGNIWTWAVESTLFRDFAEVICNDSHRFWWTQAALVYSYTWNVYMSIEGGRKKVPHLWAFFLLDQVLPVSLTQNMFLLSMVLHERQERGGEMKAATPLLQCGVSLLYLVSLRLAPSNVGGRYFFPVIGATRLFLFAPYVLLQPARENSWLVQRTSASSLMRRYTWSFATVVLGGILLQLSQTWMTTGLTGILAALHSNPAVSALGYDFLIGFLSLVCLVRVRSPGRSLAA